MLTKKKSYLVLNKGNLKTFSSSCVDHHLDFLPVSGILLMKYATWFCFWSWVWLKFLIRWGKISFYNYALSVEQTVNYFQNYCFSYCLYKIKSVNISWGGRNTMNIAKIAWCYGRKCFVLLLYTDTRMENHIH